MYASTLRLLGLAIVSLWAPDGSLKSTETICNLITDVGDLYYAKKGALETVTSMTGMKLGTGTTAVAKSGAGAALVTYLSASNVAFDATFPKSNNLGAGLGVEAQYQVTWGAGVATNSALTEAVVVNDSGTNATSTAANTISRIIFTAIDKQANDLLIILWKHKFLGA